MSLLYDKKNKDTKVRVLDDASFIGKKIKKSFFDGPGVLKFYAPWCGFCQSKVNCCNKLAESLQKHEMQVYVINGDDNPHFVKRFGLNSFPTFMEVSHEGLIVGQLKNKADMPVSDVPGIVAALCGNTPAVCKLIKDMEKCSQGK
jgi:thiol-disulfide isomerase/thioredoxin